MASAFQLLWLAFPFLFDIRVMGFDVLPDVVGYVLMFIGLRRLASLNGHFAAAAKLAPLVALVSLADVYQPVAKGAAALALGGPSFTTTAGILFTVANSVLAILNAFLVFHIVEGVIAVAKAKKNKEVVEAATPLAGEYRAVHIMLMAVWPIAALLSTMNWIAPLAQLAIAVAIYIPMATFLRRAEWDLFGPDAGSSRKG